MDVQVLLQQHVLTAILTHCVGSSATEWLRQSLVCKQFRAVCSAIPVQRVLVDRQLWISMHTLEASFCVRHRAVQTQTHFHVTGRRVDTDALLYSIGPAAVGTAVPIVWYSSWPNCRLYLACQDHLERRRWLTLGARGGAKLEPDGRIRIPNEDGLLLLEIKT
jgi:hypothetical protein